VRCVLSALACCTACGGQAVPAASSASPFIGEWQCAFVSDGGLETSSSLRMTAAPDGGLSSDFFVGGIGCELRWSASGNTASAQPDQTCGVGVGSISVRQATFSVSGDSATVSLIGVQHQVNVGSNGATHPMDLIGSVSGSCTKG